MLKNKRTRAMLWILDGLVIVGLAVFIYGYATGTFKSSASTMSTSFSDVPSTYWAYTEITTAVQFGYVGGYPDGTYKPTQTVTRDQAAVFVARAVAGNDSWVTTPPSTPHCSDVPTSNWAYKYIEYLVSQGVINSDCTFVSTDMPFEYNPTGTLSRGDMAVLLSRAVRGETGVPTATKQTFSDVTSSNQAYKYIEYLASIGAVSGYSDGTFRPTGTVTRDQLAVFMYKAFGLKEASAYLDTLAAAESQGLIEKAKAISVGPDAKTYSGTLVGTVTDSATKKPISGATVTLKCTNDNAAFKGSGGSKQTDGNGNYSMSNTKTKVVGKVSFGFGSASRVLLVFKYNLKASASGYSDKTDAVSWGNESDSATFRHDFALGHDKTHLSCSTDKKCVVIQSAGENKCQTDSDCVTTPTTTASPKTVGTVTGPVCLKGVGSTTTTDKTCNKAGYHLFKPGSPMDTNFSFTVSPVPVGASSGNLSGIVNGGGYLVKSMLNGSPVWLQLPAGTYTANSVDLIWPTTYGAKEAKGESAYSFTITSGERTNVMWYLIVQK
jgi:hypothetical protein